LSEDPAPPALAPLREVIRRYGLDARKGLGQHFILDLNLTGRIARCAGDLATGTVIEIGPGPGGLTRALLDHGAANVVAVEKDGRCVDALAELVHAYPERLRILAADALEVDPRDLGSAPRKIVANLPYNIATTLLVRWLAILAEAPDALAGLTLMVQKEVALRLVARPGSGDYGRLAVLTQWLCEARITFEVPPRAFVPPPRITSAVVVLDPLPGPRHPARREVLERVTAAAFGQRRKMLRQSLKQLTGRPLELLSAANIAPTERPEDLDIAQFCALARALDAEAGDVSGPP
jgi:16S rRNA (adenine1518-N6/adenine1519-N6)-dimethyltransferase